MEEKKTKKVKRRKLNVKRFIIFLIIVFIIINVIYSILNIRIRQIEITGTNRLSDTEIIEVADLVDYPKLLLTPSYLIKNKIKTLPLVNDVKISKNLYGKLSIKVDEAKVLFLNRAENKYVLSNFKTIDNNNYLGVPTLINYVPDEIYTKLVNGLKDIDENILEMISEIEYNPSKSLSKEIIDETRFLLRMNDQNTVYMNTINIAQLNKYIEISSAIIASRGQEKGILYLDSSTSEDYYFKTYSNEIIEGEENAGEN